MEPYRCLRAIAVPLDMDMIDTDQIFPARFMALDRRDGGFADCFMHDLRFDPTGKPNPDFILNDPRLAGAAILVAAGSYGIGSGRPGAVFSHLDYGIRVIIAQAFGPVFSAVAYKSGLLTIELDHDTIGAIRVELDADPGTLLTVDLDAQTIRSARGIEAGFAIDAFVKRIISQGKAEVDLTLAHTAAIEAIEAQRRKAVPWLF